MADERFRRPGSGPEPSQRPGLIDPAAYTLPPAPDSAPDPGLIDVRPPEVAPAERDELELGRPGGLSQRVRVGAGLAVTALVCAGLVVGSTQLRDRRETVDADGLVAAADDLRPDSRRIGVESLSPQELVNYRPQDVTPSRCVDLVQPGGASVTDAVHWQQRKRFGDDVEVLALRYADPKAARAAVQGMDRALEDCTTVTLQFRGGRSSAYEIGRRPGTGDALAYELTGTSGSYGSYLRRFGNVVVWTVGRGADGDPSERDAADDLVAELQRRATS